MKRLRRPCDRCKKMFYPTSKFNKICEDCSQFAVLNKGLVIWINRGKDILEFKDFSDVRYCEIKKRLKELNKIILLALKRKNIS